MFSSPLPDIKINLLLSPSFASVVVSRQDTDYNKSVVGMRYGNIRFKRGGGRRLTGLFAIKSHTTFLVSTRKPPLSLGGNLLYLNIEILVMKVHHTDNCLRIVKTRSQRSIYFTPGIMKAYQRHS